MRVWKLNEQLLVGSDEEKGDLILKTGSGGAK